MPLSFPIGASPFWPRVETVNLSLVTDVPTVLQVLAAVRENLHAGQAYMASQFRANNPEETRVAFDGIPVAYEDHEDRKKRVPAAIGLIRTGDATQSANVILVSA